MHSLAQILLAVLVATPSAAIAIAQPELVTIWSWPAPNSWPAPKDPPPPTDDETVPVEQQPVVAKITSSYGNWFNPTCYSDPYSNDRRLRVVPGNPSLNGTTMTIAACLNRCAADGFMFAGVEYGSECYCDSTRPHKYYIGGTCEMPCTGDQHAVCGGSQSLLVYEHSA